MKTRVLNSVILGIIVGEAERLTRLINQILDMAKLESGRAEWITSEVDLGEVVREAMESLGQLFRERSVALEGELPSQGPVVLADRDRLTQVMINLLSNAVKFVPSETGRVLVRLSSSAGLVRVEVRDKPQGTGLGLPISRQIVEYFGGNLWVESEPGSGANFIFTVPLPVPEE